MSEREIEIRPYLAQSPDLLQPIDLHAAREFGSIIEERTQRGGVFARAEELDGIEAAGLAELGADVIVHRREARRVRRAFERFEVELREVDAIPIEACGQRFHTIGNRVEAVTVREIHQFAP